MTEKIVGLPAEPELFAPGHLACAGCGCVAALRHALKASGKEVIVVSATGCMEVVSSAYPTSSWRVPWIHATFENAAAVASGIRAALKDSKTKVVAIGGDGGTFDIGFQALSGALERNTDFVYICYDNGAYMNTGIQRSGATPQYAATTTSPAGKKIPGKIEWKKNMPFIVAAHQNTYVATANMAFPLDYFNKVKRLWIIKVLLMFRFFLLVFLVGRLLLICLLRLPSVLLILRLLLCLRSKMVF